MTIRELVDTLNSLPQCFQELQIETCLKGELQRVEGIRIYPFREGERENVLLDLLSEKSDDIWGYEEGEG